MRPLVGLALLSLLTFPLVLGCGHPTLEGSAEPMSSEAPRVFVERPGAPPPDIVDFGPSCPAELGIVPASFFGDQLLVRLPPAIEGEQVPERGPNFARSGGPLAMGCEDDLSASVFVQASRRYGAETLAQFRARLYSDLNFPEHIEVLTLDGSDEGHDISLSLSFPNHPVWGGMRVYLRMVDIYDRVHTLGFMAEHRSYHLLEPVFMASAETMVALPPSG